MNQYRENKKDKRLFFLLISIILFISILIRIYDLDKNPPGFFTDEAGKGYNAYTILTTGKDEYGVTYPLFFKSSGDYKNPVFIYSLVPFIALFGLNEFSIRFTSVVYGILGIATIYLLVCQLFNKKIGLLAALFLTISPWHIHFSRVGFEVISSIFWVSFSLFLLFKSRENFNYYPLALIFLIITFFSYYPMRIYAPLLYGLFFLIHHKYIISRLKYKSFWIYNLVGLTVLIFLVWPYLLEGTFFARWNQVKLPEITLPILIKGYINHFSIDFLFKSGEIDFPGSFISRQSIRGMGMFYWFQLPFIFIGILSYFFNKEFKKSTIFFVLFLLIYPISSIFTTPIPSATHSIIGVIPFQVITALGIHEAIRFINNKIIKYILIITLSILVTFSFTRFLNLLNQYPQYSADYWGWQYGYRPIMKFFKTEEENFKELLITHRFNDGETLLKFYNVEFKCGKFKVMNNPIKINSEIRQLFALRKDDIEEAKKIYPNLEFRLIKKINLPNGSAEFYIGTFKQK